MRIVILLISLIIFTLPVNAEVKRVSLDEAVQLTLRNNLDLQAKRKELGIAEAEIKIANRLQNPQVQTNVLIGQVRTGNSSQAGLMLPIETFKRGVRKKAAIAQKKSIENQIRQFEHELKIKVMKAYFDVLYYKSIVKIMNERKELFENMKKIAQERPQSNSSYKIDNLQSDIKYKKQLIELNRSKADLISAQFNLNKVINVAQKEVMYDTQEASLFSDDLTILDIKLPDYDIIEAIALKYSHSIRIADSDIEKYGQEYILAKRRQVGKIDLLSDYRIVVLEQIVKRHSKARAGCPNKIFRIQVVRAVSAHQRDKPQLARLRFAFARFDKRRDIDLMVARLRAFHDN